MGAAILTVDDLVLRPGHLVGERVLVTAGGTGIGRMIANGCAALGARVYICGRRVGVVEETASELNEGLAGQASPAGRVTGRWWNAMPFRSVCGNCAAGWLETTAVISIGSSP